jgi:hypothetical protein
MALVPEFTVTAWSAEVGSEALLQLATQLAQGELACRQALVDLPKDDRPVLRWEEHGSGRDTHSHGLETCTDVEVNG